MSTNAMESQGIKIARGDGASPEVFTDIPEIREFTGPGGSASVIDVSDLDSTFREKILGLPDEGQLSFTVHYIADNAVHVNLRADRAARTLRNFRITWTDASPAKIWTFAGYVTEFSVSGGVDDVVLAAVVIEITGAITET